MCSQNWKQMNRKFGYSKIKWKIEDFNMLSIFERWKILSPQFYIRGATVTQWQMVLERNFESTNVLFSLKLLDYVPNISELVGDCGLRISNETKLRTEEFYFAGYSNLRTLELDYEFLKGNNVLDSSLTVELDLLVRFIWDQEEVAPCEEASVELLSDALYNLFESEYHSDVLLFVGVDSDGKPHFLSAHKAILQSRNAIWNRMISSNEFSNLFSFDHLLRKPACRKILCFLYSANMRHVLDVPMKSVFDLASAYNITPVTAYYAPDALTLYTEVLTGRFDATWVIHDALLRTEECLINLDNTSFAGMECILKFYPVSFENTDYVGVVVDFSRANEKAALVEISFKANRLDNVLRKVYRIRNGQFLKDCEFLPRILLKHYTSNGTLILGFRVRWISTNFFKFPETRLSVGTNIVTCKPYSEQENYSHLSEDMSKLYHSGQFRNFGFDLGSKCFTVNLGYFSSSCLDFYCGAENNTFSLDLTEFPFYKPESLDKLINFIYCCKIQESINPDEYASLAIFAHVLRLNKLEYLPSYILELLLVRVDERSRKKFQKEVEKFLDKLQKDLTIK